MKITLTLLVLLLLAACSSPTKRNINYQEYIETAGLQAKDRVQQFRFQGWQPLSRDYLILRSSHQKSYLVKLMNSCIDLPFANNILLDQDMNNFLHAKFDAIIVPGQASPKCRIDAIYPMNKTQRQALLDFANQKEAIR